MEWREPGWRRLVVVLLALGLVAAACSDGDDGATDPTAVPATSAPAGAEGGEALVLGEEEAEAVARPGFDIDSVLAADPNCPTPVTGDPLRIGYAADFSDIGGPADRPGTEAALHMAKLINCSGGIDGIPVEVVIQDIAGGPLDTRAGVQALIDAGVHVLLGPPFAWLGFRVLQQTKGRYGVIFTGSTEPALGNDANLSYLVAFNDTQGATAAAQFALNKGWTRAVTLSSPGPYFGYHPLVFKDVFEKSGGQVLADHPFTLFEQFEFPEIVEAIAADPPDVIYTPMFAEQLVALREQLEAAGVTGIEFLQPDAFEATGGYTLSGIDGIFHATHAFPSEGSRTTLLSDSIAAANGVPPGAPSMAALAGDAIAVIADSYLRVRTTDPQVLGEAIARAQNVQGITGVLSYNGTGLPTKPIYVHEVQNGEATLAATIGG